MDWGKVRRATEIVSFLCNKDAVTAINGIVAGDGKETATQIYESVGQKQSTFSCQCRRLKKYGVAKEIRKGKYKYFNIDENRIEKIKKAIENEI